MVKKNAERAISVAIVLLATVALAGALVGIVFGLKALANHPSTTDDPTNTKGFSSSTPSAPDPIVNVPLPEIGFDASAEPTAVLENPDNDPLQALRDLQIDEDSQPSVAGQ